MYRLQKSKRQKNFSEYWLEDFSWLEHQSEINNQFLIVPGEWPRDKNIHSVLNNVLVNNNIKSHTDFTVLFRFNDMVEAIGHAPFSIHQYCCTPSRNLQNGGCEGTCTLK
jgi:hypothetical protein